MHPEPMTPPDFESAIPVLRSSDYARSRHFFADLLGFSVVEEGGDPPRFGIFKQGRAVIFVNAWDSPPSAEKTGWDAYLHVSGLDALHRSLAGVPDLNPGPVRETVYGMIEFDLPDPDGNILCFGEDMDRSGQG